MLKAENYQREALAINGVNLTVTTYRIGERYFCHIANLDPGATICRVEDASPEAARETALSRARQRLGG